jgi:hypothetical protein
VGGGPRVSAFNGDSLKCRRFSLQPKTDSAKSESSGERYNVLNFLTFPIFGYRSAHCKASGLGGGLEFPVTGLRLSLDIGAQWIQSAALRVRRIARAQNPADLSRRRGSTSVLCGSPNRHVRQVLKPLESGIQDRFSRNVFHMHHF